MHGDLAFEEHRWFLVLGYTGTGEVYKPIGDSEFALAIEVGCVRITTPRR